MGKDESRAKTVIVRFMAMERTKASQYKRRALKDDKTYLMTMSPQFEEHIKKKACHE